MFKRLFRNITAAGLAAALLLAAWPANQAYQYRTEAAESPAGTEIPSKYGPIAEAEDYFDANEGKDFTEIPLESSSETGIVQIPMLTSSQAYQNTMEELVSLYPGTKSQGDYGLCWAFATAACAEFSMIKGGYATKSVDYSEIALAYYTYHSGTDPLGGTAGDSVTYLGSDFLEDGGNMMFTSRLLTSGAGLVPESEAPYSSAVQVANQGLTQSAYANQTARVTDVRINDILNDPEAVKEEIIKNGSVAASFYCNEAFYSGCNYYLSERHAANHAVNIVGWDDSYSRNNFTGRGGTPSSDGAWLVRNTWSETTGFSEDSYFWMSYEEASLTNEVYSYYCQPIDDFDYTYQYDGGIVCAATAYEKSANVFTVSGTDTTQTLWAVTFSALEYTNLKYDIRIYRNPTGSDPTSGTEVTEAATSGSTTAAGIYTIDLARPVEVKNGEKFSVVITLKNSYGGYVGVDRECGYYDSQWFSSTVEADQGQSYCLKNGDWYLIEEQGSVSQKGRALYSCLGNFSIKAVTKSGSGSNAVKAGAVSALAKVKGFKKAASTATTMTLKWTKSSDASGYIIYRSVNGGSYKQVATIKSASLTKWKDTGLNKNKKYSYKIKAYKKTNGVTKKSAASGAVKK